MNRFVVAAFISVMLGCGTAPAAQDTASNDLCLESVQQQVTISRGVFGQLTQGCDTMDCVVQCASGITVALVPGGHDGGSLFVQPLVETQSGDRGFYQIASGPGAFDLCTGEHAGDAGFRIWSCTVIQLSGDLQRHNWTSGPGGGTWDRNSP